MRSERLILVDEGNEPKGFATWAEAHASPGLLHRAFSAYVFRKDGTEILIQERSSKKPLWAGIWANTCCSHPRENEEIVDIAPQRLQEEFGFTCDLVPLHGFVYRADSPSGTGSEHEHVTILRGDVEDDVVVKPNPDEVGQWQWIAVDKLRDDMQNMPESFAPWFHDGLELLLPRS